MAYPPPGAPPAGPPGVPAPALRPVPVIRPSGWWYVAAVGVAVLGVVLAAYAVRQGWRDANAAGRDATATALGQEQTITIARPMSTTVAYSGLEVTYGEADRVALKDDLQVRIVAAGSGAAVELVEYEGYRPLKDVQQGRQVEYLPLYTVRFDQPGDYVLSTRTVPGVNLDESAVVVSESPFRRLRDGLRRAAALALGGIGLFVLLAMIIGRARGRAKRAWAAQHPPAPWPPVQWAPAPPAPGPWGAGPGPPGWG